MNGLDRSGEDSTFRINFDGDGLSRIRDKVEEKLKEFLGDYTDDILVEYVLMLLRNGRSRDQSQKDLNAFLGDDSVSFVSWLWDHISSNMHLYSQQKESRPNEVVKTTHILDEHSGGQKSQIEHVHGNVQTASENEREQSKFSRSRRNKEWKGLARESDPFPLRSTVSKILHPEEKTHTRSNVKQPPPRFEVQVQRKQSREEERHPMKRDAASRQVVGAARRLLQFAVRDAVRDVQQSSSRSEPALKRLRSVVSTSTADSLMDERPKRIRSVARVPGPVSAALKAAAEAAEDVSKTRCSGSVFDRLNRGTYVAEPIKLSSTLEEPMLEEPMLEDGEYEDDQIPELNHQDYQGHEYDGEFNRDMTVLDRDTGMSADSASDNDGYDGVGTTGQQSLSFCQSTSSANRDTNSLTVQYSVAQDANKVGRDTRFAKQDPPASATTNPSSKIVNISVNVNTWKPPHYQAPKDAIEADTRVTVEKTEMNAEKTNIQPPKENIAAMTGNGSETARVIVQKESQKTLASTPGSYATGRPSEDVDSRTVFVSNVNFAATKDTLSRHFNQFGEVLKVIIVNDAATGQPKGFAYVEFLRKESAESALSLNGTSFMSRVVKVVRKSSMHHAAAPMLGWPQISRASPYASRLRLPSSRGVLSGSFRARLPLKAGARSLQWKRGSSTAEGVKSNNQNTSLAAANNVPFPRGRNLTYVRQESKIDGSSGPA